MSVQLELNCLVLSDDPSHIFTVEIEDTLKELIKDKNKPTFPPTLSISTRCPFLWTMASTLSCEVFDPKMKEIVCYQIP
jgi:hypothetical protein